MMSNQEAIALLRNLEDSLDAYCELNEEGKTAFRMAIEALNCSEFPNSSDTIYRQAAIDAAIQSIMDWDGMFIQDANCRIRDAINESPSEDAIEVVRCGECVYWNSKEKWCSLLDIDMCESDYCSISIRK